MTADPAPDDHAAMLCQCLRMTPAEAAEAMQELSRALQEGWSL